MIFICLCADYLTIYMKVFVGILVFLILIKVEFIGSNSVENEIQFINNGQSLWMAGVNYLSNASDSELRHRLGLKYNLKEMYKLKIRNKHNLYQNPMMRNLSALPNEFDLRKAYPRCTVQSDIRDQSICGSCWAVSTATTFSNRVCMATGARVNIHFSGEDILRCCRECKDSDGNGCNGGDIVKAWYFLNSAGVVSGDEYGTNKGCMPYSFSPCNDYCSKNVTSEACTLSCTNRLYKRRYKFDKLYAREPYRMGRDEDAIKYEIMQYGSLLAPFHVYRDFVKYKTGSGLRWTKGMRRWLECSAIEFFGVYFHFSGHYIGAHAAVLLGWGVEKDQPYWLAANSWGTSWGEGGTFRIHRRYHGCSFGEILIGSIPIV